MNTAIKIQRLKFYALVGLVWTLLWVVNYLVNNTETFFVRLPNEIWRNVYLVAVNIVLFEYFWPFITRKRKRLLSNFGLGVLLLGIAVLLVSLGLYAWRQFGIEIHVYTVLRTDDTLSQAIAYQAQDGVLSVFFFGVMKLMYDHRNLKIAAQLLRIEKQQAELSYLKSQTNPHFLFNTLNNIYSLARDKSDLTPESILRLSQILRFMLYETGGEYIGIEQEMKIISDYIALEKLRYDDSLRVAFEFEIEDVTQPLPPLLLIPLVENAFKHGVSETRSQPFVDIHLSVKLRQLAFVVSNSFEQSAEDGSAKESIGLTNLRRQLELLYTDYNLAVQQGESVFTTTLKINLASHV